MEIIKSKGQILILKKEIPKIQDKEVLRDISLHCIDTAEQMVKIMLKHPEMFKDKDKLEGYIRNFYKIIPEIVNQEDMDELRKYAKASVLMLEKMFGIKKAKMGA